MDVENVRTLDRALPISTLADNLTDTDNKFADVVRGTEKAAIDKPDTSEICFASIDLSCKKSVSGFHCMDFKSEEHTCRMEQKHNVVDFAVARMEFEKEAEVATMRIRCSEPGAKKKSMSKLENGSVDECQNNLHDAVAIEGDSPNIKSNGNDVTRLNYGSPSTMELKSQISDVTSLSNDLCDVTDFNSKKCSMAEIKIDSSLTDKLPFDSTHILSESSYQRLAQNHDLSGSSSITNIAGDGLCCGEAQNLGLIDLKESSLVNGCMDAKANQLVSDSETGNDVSVEEERSWKSEGASFYKVSSREEKGWQLSESARNMLQQMNGSARPIPKQLNETDSKILDQMDESAMNVPELHCHENRLEEVLADKSHSVVRDFTGKDQSLNGNKLGVNKNSSIMCNKVTSVETRDRAGDNELCSCNSGNPVSHTVKFCDEFPDSCIVQDSTMSAFQKFDAEIGIGDDAVHGKFVKVSSDLLASDSSQEMSLEPKVDFTGASAFPAQDSSSRIHHAALGEDGAGVLRPSQIYEEKRSSLDLPEKVPDVTDAARNMDSKFDLKVSESEPFKLDAKTKWSLESASATETDIGASVSDADSCFDGKSSREADFCLGPSSVSNEMQKEEDRPEMPKSRSVENLSLFVPGGDSDLDKNADSKGCFAVGVQCMCESDNNVEMSISDSNSNCQSAFVHSSDSQSDCETTPHSESQSVLGIVPESKSQPVPRAVRKSESQSVFDCLPSSQLESCQEKPCEQFVLIQSTLKDQSVSQAKDSSRDELVSKDQSVSKVDPHSSGHLCTKAVDWSEPISETASGIECQSSSRTSSASQETPTQSTSSVSVASLLPLLGEGEIALNHAVPNEGMEQKSEAYCNTAREMELKLQVSQENNDKRHTHPKSENATQLTSENDGCCRKVKSVQQTTEDDNESPCGTLTEEGSMHDQMTSEKQNEVHMPTSHALVSELGETASPQVRADETAEFVSSQVRASQMGETLMKENEEVKPDEAGQVILSQLKPDEEGEMILAHIQPNEAGEVIAEVKGELSMGQGMTEGCFKKKDAVQNNSVLEVSTHRMQEQRSKSEGKGERKLKSSAQLEELESKHMEFSSEEELKQVKELEQEEMLQQEREVERTHEQYKESGPEEGMVRQDKDLGQNKKLCKEKELRQTQELAEEQETSEERQGESRLLEGNKSECREQITDETNAVDIQRKQDFGEENKPSQGCKNNEEEVEQEQMLRKQQELGNEIELRKEIKHATRQEFAEKQSFGQEQDLVKELEQEGELEQDCLHEIKREKGSEVLCTEDDENESLSLCKSLQGASSSHSDAESSLLKESSRLNMSSVSGSLEAVRLQNLENSSNDLETFSEKNFGSRRQTVLFKARGASSGRRHQSKRKSVPVSGKSVTTGLSDEQSTVDTDHIVGTGGDLVTKKKEPKTKKKNVRQVSKEKDSVVDVTDVSSKGPKRETTTIVKYQTSTIQNKWPDGEGKCQSDVNEGHLLRDEGEQLVALELVKVVDESRFSGSLLSTTSVEVQDTPPFETAALASEAEERHSGTSREPALRDCIGSMAAGLDKSCISVIASQGAEANAIIGSGTYGECQSVFEKESSNTSSAVNSSEMDDNSPTLNSKQAIDKVSVYVNDMQPVTLKVLGQLYDKKKAEEENMKTTEPKLEKAKNALSCSVLDVTHGRSDAATFCCSANSGSQVVRTGDEELVMNKNMASCCIVTSFDQSNTDDGKESDGEAVLEIDLAEGDSKNESERGMVAQGLEEYDAKKSDTTVDDEPERRAALFGSNDTYKSDAEVVSGHTGSEMNTLVPQVLEADVKKVNGKKEKGRLRKRKRQKISGKETDQQTGKSNFQEDLTEKEDQKVSVELRLETGKAVPVAGLIPEVPVPGSRDTPVFGETLTTLQQAVDLEPATATKKKAKRKPKVNKTCGKTQSGNTGEPFPEGGLGTQTFQMDFLRPVASMETLHSQLPSIHLKDNCIESKTVPDSVSSVATSFGNTTPDSNRETAGSIMRPLWEKMCLEDNSLPDPSFSSIRQLEACVKAISTNLQKRVTNSVACHKDTFPTYHPDADLGRRWLTLPEFNLTNGDPASGMIANMGTEKFSSAKRKSKGTKVRKDQQNARWPLAEQICDGAKIAEDLCGGIDKLPWIGPKQRGKKKVAVTSSLEFAALNNTELGLSKESDASSVTKSKPRNRKRKKNSACEQLNLPSPTSGPLPAEVDLSLAAAVPTNFSKKCLKISLENCNMVFSPKNVGKPLEEADPISPEGHCFSPNEKSRTKRPKKNSKTRDQSKEKSHRVNEIQNLSTNTRPVTASAIPDSNTSALMNQPLEKPCENQTLAEGVVPVNILDGIVPPEQGPNKYNQELSKITAETTATPAKPLKRKKPSKCTKDPPNLASIETSALVEKPAEEIPAKKKKNSKKVKESRMQPELIDQSSITTKLPAKSKSPAKSRKKKSANLDISIAEKHPFEMDNAFMSQEKVLLDQEILNSNCVVSEAPPKTAVELPSDQVHAKHLENNFNKVTAILDNFTRSDSQSKSAGKSTEEEKEPVLSKASRSATPDMRSSCDTTDSEHLGEKSKTWSGESSIKESELDLNSSNDCKPFACPQCSYHAKKKGQLRKHLGVHRIYSCAHCDFASGSHDELDTHMLAKHPSRCGRKLCKKCHVLFRTDALISHERDCTGEKRGWDCQVCGKKFKFVSAMRTHLRRWHSADSSIQPDDNEEDEEQLDKPGFEDSQGAGRAPSTIIQPNQPSSPFQMNEEPSQPVIKPTILCDRPFSPNQPVAEPCSTTQPCDQPCNPAQQSGKSSSTTLSSDMPSSPTQPSEKPSSTSKSCDQPSSTTQPCDSPSSHLEPSENPSSPLQIAENPSSPLQPSEKPSVPSQPCDQLSSPSQTGSSSSHSPDSCDRLPSPPNFSIVQSVPLESAKPTSESLKRAKPKRKRKSDVTKPTIEKPFFCSVCEKHFKSKKTLKSHSQTKHGFKPDLSACRVSFSNHSSAAEVLPDVPDISKEAEEMACVEKILPKSPVEELPSVNLICFFQECGRQFKKVEQLHRHEEKHAGWKEFSFTFVQSFLVLSVR